LLILVGVAMGYYHLNLGFLGKAAVLVSELNPNGVIAIFLPALIFESAFKTEWHLFKKTAGQTLILGIPCAILGALFIMASIKMIAEHFGVRID
jgi:NhaP-type Na+/H+ or K+/H+ antiporter